MGLRREIDLLATSAGNDQLLSIVAAIGARRGTFPGRVALLVPICGAWHPTRYAGDGTCVLVHHHEDDRLCPWREVREFWLALREEMAQRHSGGVYVSAPSIRDRQLLDWNYHNVSYFLLSQSPFWFELQREHEQTDGVAFADRCHTNSLGNSHLTVASGVDYEIGYDQDLEDKSHFLQLGIVGHEAMRYACAKHTSDATVLDLCINMAVGAKACKRTGSLLDFRGCFPQANGGAGWG